MEKIAPLLAQNLGAKLRLGVRRNGMSGKIPTKPCSHTREHTASRLLTGFVVRVYAYTETIAVELDRDTSSTVHSPGVNRTGGFGMQAQKQVCA